MGEPWLPPPSGYQQPPGFQPLQPGYQAPSNYPPPPNYQPPPAFTPPALRVAPLNEVQVLGESSYPPAPPSSYPTAYPPVSWQPGHTWRPTASGTGSRRRRAATLATAGSVVAALVAIIAVLVSGSGHAHAPRSLSLPDSVDGYSRVTTMSGTQLSSLFTANGGAFGAIPADDLAAAKVGVYSLRDQSPGLIFVGFTAKNSPTIGAQLRNKRPDTVADEILGGAGSAGPALRADAGPLGGALKCGEVDLDGTIGSAGVWADDDTLGIVLIVDATISPHNTSHTSAVTRDFRAKAEH